MKPYVYQTLPDEDSIRVLTIFPSADEADIRCSLELRRVAATNDLCLPIWIDAICINQTDVEEREATVARMADIYEGSNRLFVWLGNGNDPIEDDRMQYMLECMGERCHRHYKKHVVSTREGGVVVLCLARAAFDATYASNKFHGRNRMKSPPPLEPLPKCLRQLFDAHQVAVAVQEVHRLIQLFISRRYWTRRWIIQEHAFGNRDEVLLMWGPTAGAYINTVMFAAFDLTNSAWREIDQAFNAHVHSEATGFKWLDKMHQIQRVLGFGNWVPAMAEHGQTIPSSEILSLVSWFAHDFQCSDPRDIVYALQSLGPRRDLRPDYSMTAAEVFAASCADKLKDGMSLPSVLYEATTHVDVDELTAALPSWCPDLRQQPVWVEDRGPLEPYRVRSGKILECTLLLHGVLQSTNTVAEAAETEPVDNICPSGFETMTLKCLIGKETQVGDLVCGFSRDERNDVKVILRRSGAGLPDVRLIASGRLRVPAWRQDKHALIALHIH
ncbi:hypothetical protein LTR95_005134 [Oleoguttula sp. CCFEE 5521]